MSTRPLVGVTGRQRLAGAVRDLRPSVAHSRLDLHFADYSEHLVAAGAAPVERLDGLVLSGGADIDPRRYGRTPGPGLTLVEPGRDEFELQLVACAWELRLPVFAICRGMQILAIARGGSLMADLPPDRGEGHPGEQYPTSHRIHRVRCDHGTLAHVTYGASVKVNSLHHQAIDDPGEGITISGRADDGIAEIAEVTDRPVLAVQWHPERLAAPEPGFAWLVERARDRRETAPCA